MTSRFTLPQNSSLAAYPRVYSYQLSVTPSSLMQPLFVSLVFFVSTVHQGSSAPPLTKELYTFSALKPEHFDTVLFSPKVQFHICHSPHMLLRLLRLIQIFCCPLHVMQRRHRWSGGIKLRCPRCILRQTVLGSQELISPASICCQLHDGWSWLSSGRKFS